MKTLVHSLGAGLLLVASVASAQAWNRPLKNAADAVEDAFDRTQRARGQCRNQLGPTLNGLVDRIDALRRAQFPVQELNQLRFELATVAQQAPFAACPIGVTEDLQRALDGLEEARIAMWNGGGRERFGGGSRRDRRGDNPNQPPGAVFPFVNIAPLRVTPNVPFQNERAVQVTVPEVRFDFMQGQGFYLATKFRSFEGDWSEWVTTQLWTVPSTPFQWRNAYNHVLRYSTLAEEDFSNGRFIVHVAVFNGQGQELAFREATFRVNLPNVGFPGQPPPVVQRDCGTGPQDPGCMMVRDGAWAMDAATYQGFLTSLRANRSEVLRLQMAQSMLAQQYLTAAQFATMMDLFSSEVMRLDFSQRAAPRLVNPQHAIGLSSKFRSAVFQTQYTQLMAAQPAGVPWQPGLMGPMGVVIQPPGFGQPGVVVQPGVMQPGVVVQVPGMTVQVQDPNVPPAVVQPGFGQPAVVQPAVVQPIGMVRDCGTGPNDPGCGLMRNGLVAMDAQVFSGFMRSLRAVMNELTREDMCEKMLARNGLTAMQLGQVLDLFNNEITRLDVAKMAASKVVNPQHALELSTKFNNSFSAEEFVEVYSGQH